MKKLYDFEKNIPPVVTEKTLREEMHKRQLRMQILLLRIASVAVLTSIVLFAFLISRDSLAVSVMCIVFICISVMENGIISLLFYRRKGTDKYEHF